MHGDYRLGNAIFSREAPARVVALVNWEMGTLGDPPADPGYLCATWTDRRDEHRPACHLSSVIAAPGFPTRGELVERYERRSGRSAAQLPWYCALAAWKSAVFMEGNYRRAASGMSDDPWAARVPGGSRRARGAGAVGAVARLTLRAGGTEERGEGGAPARVPGRARPKSWHPDQRPCHTGLRFSRNARGPSWPSSLR